MFWVWQTDGNGVWITAYDRYEAAAKYRDEFAFDGTLHIGSKDGTHEVGL